MKDCVWCVYNKNVCEDALVERTCDFKTLPFEKEAIFERMLIEKSFLEGVVGLKGKVSERELRVAMDKAAGLVIMSKVLKEKFGVTDVELKRRLGSKKFSWSERMKLSLMVKLMQKEKR